MPARLFSHWLEVEGRLRSALGLLLILDYDGTLIPHVVKLEDVKLSEEARKVLSNLVKDGKWVKVAIVSDRSIEELKKLVALEKIYYLGLNGLEVEGPELSFIHSDLKHLLKASEGVRKEVAQALIDMKEVWVEERGLGITIHYPTTPRTVALNLSRTIRRFASMHRGWRLLKRKGAYELSPKVEWDRGRAVLQLIEVSKLRDFITIYVGGDEVVFRTLAPRGITIAVGMKRWSLAKFYVKNVDGVLDFLRKLEKLVTF